MRLFFILVFFLSQSSLSLSDTQTSFELGVKNYSQKNYDQALKHFQDSNTAFPNNTDVLYNLGLTYFHKKDYGLAAAYWRKAQHLSPFRQDLKKSMKLLEKSLPRSNRASNWETFRQSLLNYMPIRWILIALTLAFVIFSFGGSQYFIARRLALKNNLPLPDLKKRILISTLATLVLVSLLACKLVDLNQPRGTITNNQAKFYLGPSEEDISIFEPPIGAVVIIKKTLGKWAKVEIPGGTSGWTLAKNFLYTFGEPKNE